ncbi:MAG TPA: DUF2461 domain-containing protein [Ohtaekwangia sp.]|nr:DUF2461 domain-containing protein [Ohtaekwangia sp.]
MDFANAFKFLQKLSRNNNREWFEKNKDQWLQIKTSFEGFISDVYDKLCEIDPPLSGQDPKKLVFRIYRDVRFSKDKRPYKTFLSAGISPVGKGIGVPGYYIQFEPGNRSFLCTGLYAPSAEALAKVRQEIDYNGSELKKILSDRSFRKYYDGFWEGDPLKTAPKGYPKDHEYIEWLKLRHFVVMHPLSDQTVLAKNFRTQLLKTLAAGKPFRDFLMHALE